MVQVKEVKTSQRESSKPAKSTKSAKSPAKPAKAPAKSVKAPAKPAKAPAKPAKEPVKVPEKPVKEPVKAPEKPVKVPIKRTSIKITRRPPIVAKTPPKVIEPIDTAKAVAFAMSIAQEMKRNAREAAEKRENTARNVISDRKSATRRRSSSPTGRLPGRAESIPSSSPRRTCASSASFSLPRASRRCRASTGSGRRASTRPKTARRTGATERTRHFVSRPSARWATLTAPSSRSRRLSTASTTEPTASARHADSLSGSPAC